MEDRQDGILGLDFGTEKVGVAISHGFIAESLSSIRYRDNKEKFYQEIKGIINKQKVGQIIIGLPLNEGKESIQSNWIRQQAMDLSKNIGLEIEFVDESYTTTEAIDNLSGKGDIDSESAKVILEQYLNNRTGGGR